MTGQLARWHQDPRLVEGAPCPDDTIVLTCADEDPEHLHDPATCFGPCPREHVQLEVRGEHSVELWTCEHGTEQITWDALTLADWPNPSCKENKGCEMTVTRVR